MRRTLATLLLSALAIGGLVACGDDDGDDAATTTTEAATTSTTLDTEGTSTTGATTTTAAGGSTTTPSGDPADLPGERIEIFPYEGATLAVVGVDREDVLNLRAAPGADQEQVATLAPLADDVAATGHNRQLADGSIWVSVERDGETLWANGAFFAQLGDTRDITADLIGTGERPAAETMLDLGQQVGEMQASDEPPSDIVVVDGPTVGDLGEVTVDVIGLGDDAQKGVRLHVFATEAPGGEGFVLRTVEATALCARGVTDDLLCV